MYNVSEAYKRAIQEPSRTFSFKATIQTKTQHDQMSTVITLNKDDIVHSTISYNEASQGGDNFTVGGAVASDIDFEIINQDVYDGLILSGGIVEPIVSVLVDETLDKWEDVPLGVFTVSEVDIKKSTTRLRCSDYMIKFNKDYNPKKTTYPISISSLISNVCIQAGVELKPLSNKLVNLSYRVNSPPISRITLRNMVEWIAQITGSFARMDRSGKLEFTWYEETGVIITPDHRYTFKAEDNVVQLDSITAVVGDVGYSQGIGEYNIDLEGNELLNLKLNGEGDDVFDPNVDMVLHNVLTKVGKTYFNPYNSESQGNPAMQAGDKIRHITYKKEKPIIYDTIVTKASFNFRGHSKLEAKGLPLEAKVFKSSMDNMKRNNKSNTNAVRSVSEKIDRIEDKFSSLQGAPYFFVEFGPPLSNDIGKDGDLWFIIKGGD